MQKYKSLNVNVGIHYSVLGLYGTCSFPVRKCFVTTLIPLIIGILTVLTILIILMLLQHYNQEF